MCCTARRLWTPHPHAYLAHTYLDHCVSRLSWREGTDRPARRRGQLRRLLQRGRSCLCLSLLRLLLVPPAVLRRGHCWAESQLQPRLLLLRGRRCLCLSLQQLLLVLRAVLRRGHCWAASQLLPRLLPLRGRRCLCPSLPRQLLRWGRGRRACSPRWARCARGGDEGDVAPVAADERAGRLLHAAARLLLRQALGVLPPLLCLLPWRGKALGR